MKTAMEIFVMVLLGGMLAAMLAGVGVYPW